MVFSFPVIGSTWNPSGSRVVTPRSGGVFSDTITTRLVTPLPSTTIYASETGYSTTSPQ